MFGKWECDGNVVWVGFVYCVFWWVEWVFIGGSCVCSGDWIFCIWICGFGLVLCGVLGGGVIGVGLV